MQVAVKHATDERTFHESDHAGTNHRFGVDTRVLHSCHVIEVETLEPFHDEDTLRY